MIETNLLKKRNPDSDDILKDLLSRINYFFTGEFLETHFKLQSFIIYTKEIIYRKLLKIAS